MKSGKKIRGSTIINEIGIHLNNVEPCKKVYQANVHYCSKPNEDGSQKFIWQWPTDFINIKNSLKETSKKQSKKEAVELAKQGKFDQIDGSYWLTYEKQLKRIYTDNLPVERMFFDQGPGKNYFMTFNCLLYGKTGVGKTWRVEQIIYSIKFWWQSYCNYYKLKYEEPTVYKKQMNKWWDDYLGEKIVVIEELEPNWVQMAQSNLKMWFDSEPFPAETKGGHIGAIRPWFIITTSNYDLADLCGFQKEGFNPKVLYEPLNRRINCIKVSDFNQMIDFPNLRMLYDYFNTIADVKKNYLEQCKQNAINLMKKHNQFGYQEDPEEQPLEPVLLPSEDEATTSGRPLEEYVYAEEVPGMSTQLEQPKRRRLENSR